GALVVELAPRDDPAIVAGRAVGREACVGRARGAARSLTPVSAAARPGAARRASLAGGSGAARSGPSAGARAAGAPLAAVARIVVVVAVVALATCLMIPIVAFDHASAERQCQRSDHVQT